MSTQDNFEIKYFEAEFASEVMDKLPSNTWIDKTIGGCGLSHLALTDENDALILSPRVALIENKVSQKDKYPELMPVYAGVGRSEVLSYMEKQKHNNRPAKIYATYNSVGLSKLDYLFEETNCRIYVDESQYLLEFAENSPELCIELHKKLEKYVDRVTFFSAHPPKVEYMPEYIRNMHMQKYIWSDTTKATPYVIDTNKTYWAASQILNNMVKDGKYDAGNGFTFKKAIVFVNSVSAIKKIINSLHIDKKHVAYIVGDTVINDSKLNKVAHRLTDVNNLPLITFGTSSMISGIDLYDEEAANIVISSTTKEWTMFDQELDVPQAITRQRLKHNPFRNRFMFILNKAEMQSKVDSLEEKYDEALYKVNQAIVSLNYLKEGDKSYEDAYPQYVGYYMLEGDKFVVNESLLLAKKYKFKELFNQYQRGYNIRGTFSPQVEVSLDNIKAPEYGEYATAAREAKSLGEKLEVVETVHNEGWKQVLLYGIKKDNILINPKDARDFYESRTDYRGIALGVTKMFKVDTTYTVAAVKSRLQLIYDKKGLNRKAKATDISEFFDVENTRTRLDGKTVRVVRIKKSLVKY